MRLFSKLSAPLSAMCVLSLLIVVAESQSAVSKNVQNKSRDNSQIKAVMRFAETVMQHGRDVYGQKHTPLFVDGLNVDTVKPPEKIQSWSGGEGMQPWISSNLGHQGNLMRFLAGLSRFTGDPKYQKAMQAAIRYNFDHFQGAGGLLPMGHHRFIELKRDNYHGDVSKEDCCHELKGNYPYYEIFWEVNPDGTEKMVQGIWLWHMRKWDNLVTLLERVSRHVLIGYTKTKFADQVTAEILRMLKGEIVKTITFDNGKEFAGHEQIASKLDCKCFFAKPYHSWERGANENTNGLIRQYFPKKMSFAKLTTEQIAFVQHSLNTRPRKCLDFKPPDIVYCNRVA